MDIKNLGLVSTIAVLSVTVALSGCDMFKSKKEIQSLAELKKARDKADKEAKDKADKEAIEARDKALNTLRCAGIEENKAYRTFGIDSVEYKKASAEYRDVSNKVEALLIEIYQTMQLNEELYKK